MKFRAHCGRIIMCIILLLSSDHVLNNEVNYHGFEMLIKQTVFNVYHQLIHCNILRIIIILS